MEQSKSKLLEERLYADFYKVFERDKTQNGTTSKKIYNLANCSQYICTAGTIGLGAYLAHEMHNPNFSPKYELFLASVTLASADLTTHMHGMKQVFEKMYKKNSNNKLSKEEIEKVRTAGKIGRYAHFGAGTAMLGAFGSLMILIPNTIILAPILPLWYKYTIKKGYGALYSAAIDYTTANPANQK